MGVLKAMAYPTKLFANLADHTYVECGTGRKAWGCWGGKTGGRELRRGTGSTKRADCIARPDERANIKCYLINGVCHQAANRILSVAGITVAGARGYSVSTALYGVYGRPSGPFGLCPSPFNTCPDVTGDLSECIEAQQGVRIAPIKKAPKPLFKLSAQDAKREATYLKNVQRMYQAAEPTGIKMNMVMELRDRENFMVELFSVQVEYGLGGKVDKALSGRLVGLRRSAERSITSIEEVFQNEKMSAAEFMKEFNSETLAFQDAMAGAMKADQLKSILGIKRDERVTLADPKIMKAAYPNR